MACGVTHRRPAVSPRTPMGHYVETVLEQLDVNRVDIGGRYTCVMNVVDNVYACMQRDVDSPCVNRGCPMGIGGATLGATAGTTPAVKREKRIQPRKPSDASRPLSGISDGQSLRRIAAAERTRPPRVAATRPRPSIHQAACPTPGTSPNTRHTRNRTFTLRDQNMYRKLWIEVWVLNAPCDGAHGMERLRLISQTARGSPSQCCERSHRAPQQERVRRPAASQHHTGAERAGYNAAACTPAATS